MVHTHQDIIEARSFFKQSCKRIWREDNDTSAGNLYFLILVLEAEDVEEIKFCVDNGIDVNAVVPMHHINLLNQLGYNVQLPSDERARSPINIQEINAFMP